MISFSRFPLPLRRRHLLAGTALVLASTLRAASEFGVSIHNLEMGPIEMRAIADTGFAWVRMDFTWSQMERQQGVYDFSRTDRFVQNVRQTGLRAIIILSYGNPLYATGNSLNRADTDEFRTAYANWAAAVVSRYAGNNFLWEIWNEPNIERFWPPTPRAADYVQLVQGAAIAIHARAPDEKLIGPGGSGIPLGFLEKCFTGGMLEHWAAVSVHPYRSTSPETAATEYAQLRALIARYAPAGRQIPILVSEWGYSTASREMDEARQADAVTAMFTLSRSEDIPVTIWYDWRDDGAEENVSNRYGLVRYARDAAGQLITKPAWQAAKDFLRGATPPLAPTNARILAPGKSP